MSKRIYLDYASLTPVDPAVLREMKQYSLMEYANPSSLYKEGVAAKKALNEARAAVAGFIHAHADEIVFTGGGTEANGLAIEGAGRTAHRNGIAKPHLIISAVEHSSVMETANMMEKHGVEVTRIPVGSSGAVSAEEIKKAIKPNTFMVSVMTVNNEIGTIQPIREIAKAIRWARTNITKTQYPLFHTDAAQGVLFENLYVEQLGVDLMTLDGGKAYGPRGIGALYVRRDTPIEQIIYGGGQERSMRSGTENIPAIKGFAKALELAAEDREGEAQRVGKLKVAFLEGLLKIQLEGSGQRSDITKISVNPERAQEGNASATRAVAAPHILNVSIPGIDSEFFVLQLDAKGIAVSTKSSCLRDSDESYVLAAIGADSKTAVRFSFGRWTTQSDIRAALKVIAKTLTL